jgi:inosine-uridine nucleoside N-ribohydrolase
MNPPRKFILDCDPGVDDAMALYFALAQPGLELLGITTTFGNVSVAQATRNALYLCALAGRSIPVCPGVATPLRKPPVQPDPEIHGADGLGNLPQRQPLHHGADERSAARFIVEQAQAHPGELCLVATGPLGNLAQALRLEPQLPQLLRRVVVMGGTILEPGNVSPVAESNVWHDPHAAYAVFTAGFALTMVGLDVTHHLALPLALFERLALHHQHPATDTLLHAARFFADFHARSAPDLAAARACYGHDVLAVMALMRPDLFTMQAGRVRVATEGLAEGQTILDRREQLAYPQPGWEESIPRIQVGLQVDAPACLALFEDALMRLQLPRQA